MDKKVYEFISTKMNDPIVEWKTCKVSGQPFAIFQSDVDFYTKISPVFDGVKYTIPTPTLCPEERQRRRLLFRNKRKFYKRKCDLTGQDIISIYSPDKHYKVYNNQDWRSDVWDPMEYGQDFDAHQSFFDQFRKLFDQIPHIRLLAGQSNENSEYANHISNLKNCYLVSNSYFCEECYYDDELLESKNIIDSQNVTYSEHVYESSNVYKGYNVFFCDTISNCSDSYFLTNCTNTSFSLYCSNLVNKNYYYQNKPISKDEYLHILQGMQGTGLKRRDSEGMFHMASNIINGEHCFGDNISDSKDCIGSYNLKESLSCKYCYDAFTLTDCMDIFTRGRDSSLMYESQCVGNNNHTIIGCTLGVSKSTYMYYCSECQSCNNCFGCSGLKLKEYCILNKQYTKEEYEKIVPQIIAHMQSTGERGEFFDPRLSPFGYNETVAQEAFPLTREEALARGYTRQDISYDPEIPAGAETLTGDEIPSDISSVSDDILKKIFICEVSGRPFRIIKQELEFYRKHSLPLPRKHPDVRHMERIQQRPGRELYLRNCDKCGIEMLSVYPSDYQGKVYCEQCYNKEIYG